MQLLSARDVKESERGRNSHRTLGCRVLPASMYDCRHNRARVYHLNLRALYAAVREADSRFRKPVTLNHAIHRLMVLDAIVEDPDLVWLGTAGEKSAHLTTLIRIELADLPHITVGEGDTRAVRYFPDRLPIGGDILSRHERIPRPRARRCERRRRPRRDP
jgi:hypothetical protein